MDRFELVEVVGSGENWRLKTILKFCSLDQASQSLIEYAREFPNRHFTLYERHRNG